MAKSGKAPKGYYSASQVMKILGIGSSTLYHFVKVGKIRRIVPPDMREGWYPQEDIANMAKERGGYREMYTGLALVDLDKTIAFDDARTTLAREERDIYLRSAYTKVYPGFDVGILNDPDRLEKMIPIESIEKEGERIFYRELFNPGYIYLDVIAENAVLTVHALEEAGYQVCFFTSRPEIMREETIHWLDSQGFSIAQFGYQGAGSDQYLWMMPNTMRLNFQVTAIWKAGMIETLFKTFGYERILVIDDNAKNRKAIRVIRGDLPLWAMLFIVESLDEALLFLEENRERKE